jgi:predicted hydrocarbon binding protein
MKTESEFHYPNRMGRILLQAIEEILGTQGMHAVLHLAGQAETIDDLPADNLELKVPFSHISGIQIALENLYGPCAGRGVATRVGRVSFPYLLRDFRSEMGLTNLAFRMLPMPARILKVCEALAELFNTLTDQRVKLEHDKVNIYWQIERCPYCWSRQAEEPVCSLAVGLLQEALHWACSGRHFNVEETSCLAAGDGKCTFVITQTPLS